MSLVIDRELVLLLLLLLSLLWLLWLLLQTKSQTQSDPNPSDEPEPVIGIDLGTMYSSVGIYKNGNVIIIPNEDGKERTPSYVAFKANGERLIGDSAMSQLTSNPKNTIFDVKRFIGRKWHDRTVREDLHYYPFNIIENNNKPYIKVMIGEEERFFAPEEISAMVIGKMKQIAENYLKRNVTKAVIIVPACFNKAQRRATKDAGTIAGLKVLKIMNEPTARAVAHGLINRVGERYVLVVAIGAGSFDVSLLKVDQGIFEVMANRGDTHLGGEDFTHRVMDELNRLHIKNTGKDIRKYDPECAFQKLRREVEKAKRTLYFQNQTKIEMEYLVNSKHVSYTLTKSRFEELIMDKLRSIEEYIYKVFNDVDMDGRIVDEIILVGGSNRIPKIQQFFKGRFFSKKPVFYVNTDESAAYGAAIQGAVLSGVDQVSDVMMIDVNPFTMWYEKIDKTLEKLIPRNARLPFEKTEIFTTADHYQPNMALRLFEGESMESNYNLLLGTLVLLDIPRVQKGRPNIEVTFKFVSVGFMTVSAKDIYTKNKIEIEIQKNIGLSPEEKGKMIRDAKTFAENDKRVKEITDTKNELEHVVYSLKYLIREQGKLGKKLSKEGETLVNEIMEVTIRCIESIHCTDIDQLKKKKIELEQMIKLISSNLYQENSVSKSKEWAEL